MAKRILSVGFEFPGNMAEYIPFNSDRSLLDADIVVFEPSMLGQYSLMGNYQGKPRLTDHDSFKAVEDAAHWQSELKAAFDAGKTIFIFLCKLEEFFVFTGEREYSGTGRNRATTSIVTAKTNYSCLPIKFDKVIPSRGEEIKAAKDLGVLASYWKEFADYSVYEVYLEGKVGNTIFTTKTGNRIVGTIAHGRMIFLPPLRYDEESFVKFDEKSESDIWTPKAMAFGKSLLSHLVEIDNAIRSNRELTPPPAWAKEGSYRLARETTLEREITLVTKQIGELT